MTDVMDNDFPRGGFANPLDGLQVRLPGSEASVSGLTRENAPETPLQAVQEWFGPVVVGVHGLFSRGTANTDLILKELAVMDHPVLEFDWGPRPAIWSRIFIGRFADRLIKALDGFGPVHVVAHSFGPAIVREAMKRGQKFATCTFFNPALLARSSFPEDKYDYITVVANPYDEILTVGKRFLGAVGYGDMGRVGYQGKSPRVHTIYGSDPNLPGLRDHSSAFSPENLKRWAGHIDLQLRNAPTTHHGVAL